VSQSVSRTSPTPPLPLINELDHLRLSRWLPARHATGPLAQRLALADLVLPPDMPPDVVTMRSRLRVQALPNGPESCYTLSYPNEADPARGDLSVLSPAGAALLGLRVGDEAHWPTLDGQVHAVRLLELLYQPEAAGEWAR
jgi:regulator of nucleoside diphosphate kinase